MGTRLTSVALLSASLVAFQLTLMQILSVVQWYHFAYMVISVALLAFGASGTLIALGREWFLKRADFLTPVLMILSGAAMAVVVRVSQHDAVRFDSYLLFVEWRQSGTLLLTYLTFVIPFFLGALALCLIFVRHVQQIGHLYCANLLGSGVGGFIALWLLWLVAPQQLPSLLALLPAVAALLVLPSGGRTPIALMAIAAIALTITSLYAPSGLNLSEYKSLRRILNLPDAKIEIERSSPHGLVHVVSSAALRYAPGLSVNYLEPVEPCTVVYNNGDWFGPVVSKKNRLLRYSTLALPYILRSRENVLVLESRTGVSVAQALDHHARDLTAVESHSTVLSLLRRELVRETDSLFFHPAVHLRNMDPRTFLAGDTAHYDAILLPTLDAFGGTSGLFAMQEQYLLTTEAFHQMWQRLTPDGVICVSSWMDHPVRNPLRVLATFVAMLDAAGVRQPAEHIAAIRNWGTITFAVKRNTLTQGECDSVRAFCQRLLFDPVLLPQLESAERNRYNVLTGGSFFTLLDRVISDEREEQYASYDFNIRPATDNRPYFSQFLRWRNIPRMIELFGQHAFPFLELASFIIALTLMQIAVLALMLIVLPLCRGELRFRGPLQTIVYFGALGLGYMFVEMVLIQRFVLYLGHPMYATATVIGAMLVCSGAGSLLSARLEVTAATVRKASGLAALMIVIYGFLTPGIFAMAVGLHESAKILFSCLLVSPLAFVMGFPFPLGLRCVAERNPAAVAWAWGINGCMSVIAAPLATLVAVEAGFLTVICCAAVSYAGASAARIKGPA